MSMARLSAATASRAAALLGAAANMASSLRCWNLSFFSRICNSMDSAHLHPCHCLEPAVPISTGGLHTRSIWKVAWESRSVSLTAERLKQEV